MARHVPNVVTVVAFSAAFLLVIAQTDAVPVNVSVFRNGNCADPGTAALVSNGACVAFPGVSTLSLRVQCDSLTSDSNWFATVTNGGVETECKGMQLGSTTGNSADVCEHPIPSQQNALSITVNCATDVDCVVGEWSDWSTCDQTCGSGFQYRERSVLTPAANGGAACPVVRESRVCTNGACPVHCVMTDWSAWSECSASCGSAIRTSMRSVVTFPANGGDACPTDTLRTQPCNLPGCPVDCKTSEWSAWGNCSKTCGGGETTRTRSIVVAPLNGGTTCGALEQTVPCNSQLCPVDCSLSEWSTWSECSQPCGGGERNATRSILIPPSDGGVPCGITVKKEMCNRSPCTIECPAWGNWSACTASCDGGIRTRTRNVSTPLGVCSNVTFETEACNTESCPVDCTVSNWGNWSECSASCAGGFKTRHRTVITQDTFGGQQCPPLSETVACNTAECGPDCEVSEWSNFSSCSVTCGDGLRTRTRRVITPPGEFGKTCPSLEETVVCSLPTCEFCLVSEWSPLSECSATCGGGNQTRSRMVTIKSPNAKCPPLTEEVGCNEDVLCPQDCVTTAWTLWTPCSKSCGGGLQYRTRKQITPAQNGGRACGPLDATVSCNIHDCPVNHTVNCKTSAWSLWSSCSVSCGVGIQTRQRSVESEPQHGGEACPALTEMRSCNHTCAPVNCKMSEEFGPWGQCTKTCGGGVQRRSKSVLQHPENGGTPCPISIEERECNEQECQENCVVNQSGPIQWGQCSVSCGGGVRVGEYQVIRPASGGGLPCAVEKAVCNTLPCPVDCVLESTWGPWGACSHSCGGGVSTRRKEILQPAANGGDPCPSNVETKTCNTQKCPQKCEVGNWSAWSECSATCGGGRRTRSRVVTQPGEYDAAPCPELTDFQDCGLEGCPQHCVLSDWSHWSKCSATCGAGTAVRTRKVLTPPAQGGRACGATREERDCHVFDCPAPCKVSEWSDWSECSAPAKCGSGGGLKKRVREIIEPAVSGGDCPVLEEVVPCENSIPCDQVCVMSPWSKWSPCSVTCGTGVKARRRVVVTPPAHGAQQCGPLEELAYCNASTACPASPPTTHAQTTSGDIQPNSPHCQVSTWSEWSPCSSPCGGGIQSRQRRVVKPARLGGKECPSTMKEHAQCNTHSCPTETEKVHVTFEK